MMMIKNRSEVSERFYFVILLDAIQTSIRISTNRRSAQSDRKLTQGIEIGEKYQTFLGVTGSGKHLPLPML
jgi:excinuclease UvrABC helicase subunit UvrB